MLALLDLFAVVVFGSSAAGRLRMDDAPWLRRDGATDKEWTPYDGAHLAPTIESLRVAQLGESSAFLEWSVRADSSFVTNRLSCHEASRGPWAAAAILGSGVVSWTLDNLLPSTSYECRVVAWDDEGYASGAGDVRFKTAGASP